MAIVGEGAAAMVEVGEEERRGCELELCESSQVVLDIFSTKLAKLVLK